MFKRLTILTIFAWCLIGSCNTLFAQEGGDREFGKKNQQPEVDETSQDDEDVTNNNDEELDERPALQPSRIIKNTTRSRAGKINKSDSLSQAPLVKPKQKEAASKHNILLYYIYKMKHEDSDSKTEE